MTVTKNSLGTDILVSVFKMVKEMKRRAITTVKFTKLFEKVVWRLTSDELNSK